MTKTQFTTAAFERSHMSKPRGRGSWAFCTTTSPTAFDRELTSEPEFFNGTLTEAKRQAAEFFPTGSLLALLP